MTDNNCLSHNFLPFMFLNFQLNNFELGTAQPQLVVLFVPVVCNKPNRKIGKCGKRITMWTFYKKHNKCVPYFGCRGKGNRFDEKAKCERKCISGEGTIYQAQPQL